MGKLLMIGNVMIVIYGNDHLPPHFHVVSPDFRAVVEIETLTVMRGAIKGKNGKAALAWAAEHRAEIVAEWNRLNRFPAK